MGQRPEEEFDLSALNVGVTVLPLNTWHALAWDWYEYTQQQGQWNDSDFRPPLLADHRLSKVMITPIESLSECATPELIAHKLSLQPMAHYREFGALVVMFPVGGHPVLYMDDKTTGKPSYYLPSGALRLFVNNNIEFSPEMLLFEAPAKSESGEWRFISPQLYEHSYFEALVQHDQEEDFIPETYEEIMQWLRQYRDLGHGTTR